METYVPGPKVTKDIEEKQTKKKYKVNKSSEV